MYKKILVTGINGQVGHALMLALANDTTLAHSVVGLDRSQLNLANEDEIRRVIQALKPDLIINPAAYTAVDKAETEPELAYAINATAPRVLAEEAARIGARLIHFSTDYVYSGTKSGVYSEQDATEPLSVYGKSKLAGEDAIRQVGLPQLIFRTSWVYGAYGKNFLKTILRLAAEREQLRIVADQFGAPTTSTSIAQAIIGVMQHWHSDGAANSESASNQSGIYHLVNAGQTTWHGFATAIIEDYTRLQQRSGSSAGGALLKATAENIEAISTAAFPTPAARPANSSLDCTKLARDFSVELPHWREALLHELQVLQQL
jgi:dTDP-4-dehydrorhamnose reductase